LEQFAVANLSGFGCEEMSNAICAAGALLAYAREMHRSTLAHLQGINVDQQSEVIILDETTRRNLELEKDLAGRTEYSLAHLMDTCVTPMGSRLQRRWLNQPLRDRTRLRLRHQCVESLILELDIETTRDVLRAIGDMERVLTRIALQSARPRDLVQLRNALQALPALHDLIDAIASPLRQSLSAQISRFPETYAYLDSAIVDSPPLMIRDGGVIAPGFDAELDELRKTRESARKFLSDLEIRERESSGLPALKVGYNRVHGYYIEISRSLSGSVPDRYVRRQTLKSTERYITPELKGFEDRVLSASEKALAREHVLYAQVLESLLDELKPLQTCASALAELDVLISFAERATTLQFKAPDLTEDEVIEVHQGRHPVVESVSAAAFVPNDIELNRGQNMLIITGPNMGGKSTYMRQTALIAILAHAGSFVPAESARIGPIDRIFTRVGAADDIASGRSTFMVEMTEAASILNNASAHSLVLIDEIGRGTSTFDGMALAWATAAYLADELRAYTLFATHFFELTLLADQLPGVKNVRLDAVEHGKHIVFLHTVKDGPANRSYGLQVAALAGIPKAVLEDARNRLLELESRELHLRPQADEQPQPDLFDHRHPLVEALEMMNPDDMSPLQALEALYRLRSLLE